MTSSHQNQKNTSEPSRALSPRERLLQQATRPQSAMRYNDFKMLIEKFGFKLATMNRLHNIFVHEKMSEMVNVQNVNGEVKPFHVRQIFNLIQQYQLRTADEPAPVFDPKAMP